jgi:hypothetical protein
MTLLGGISSPSFFTPIWCKNQYNPNNGKYTYRQGLNQCHKGATLSRKIGCQKGT